MSWALEEYCEDAVLAYLTSKLAKNLLALYPAWTDEEIKYPCAVIHAGESRNLPNIGFTGHREIEINVAVISPAKAVGSVSARYVNRSYRNAVIEAFAQTALQDDINALGPFGVVFSLAEIGDMSRSVEADKRMFVSEITLNVIASPKTLI